LGRAGEWRLASARWRLAFSARFAKPAPTRRVANVNCGIMQPNLQQDVRFNYAANAKVRRIKSDALSDRASGPQSTCLPDATSICPDSAFPFFPAREADAMAQSTICLPGSTILITGLGGAAPDFHPRQNQDHARLQGDLCHRELMTAACFRLIDNCNLVPFRSNFLPFQDCDGKEWLCAAYQGSGGSFQARRGRAMDIQTSPPRR